MKDTYSRRHKTMLKEIEEDKKQNIWTCGSVDTILLKCQFYLRFCLIPIRTPIYTLQRETQMFTELQVKLNN